MKINKLTLHHFRAFYGEYTFDFAGKNVLVYGENGSGKTSLYYALKTLVKAGSGIAKEQQKITECFRQGTDVFLGNSFAYQNGADESLSLYFEFDDNTEYSLRENEEPQQNDFLKYTYLFNPFLHYKRLLKVYAATRKIKKNNNLYEFFKTILQGYPIDLQQNQFLIDLDTAATEKEFDKNFQQIIESLQGEITKYLEKFKTDIALDNINLEEASLRLKNPPILLEVSFHTKNLDKYHSFLNEARLSGLALSVYFATIKDIYDKIDQKCLKILVLDDLLLGLDMSNRQIVFDILRQDFEDFQIIFLTYDKGLYEFFQRRVEDSKWKYLEMYAVSKEIEIEGEKQTIEVPYILNSTKNDLDIAKRFFARQEYQCCALYIRKSLENICDRKLTETEKRDKNCNELDLAKKLDRLKHKFVAEGKRICQIQNIRKEILNPASHDDIAVPIFKAELQEAIAWTEQLEQLK